MCRSGTSTLMRAWPGRRWPPPWRRASRVCGIGGGLCILRVTLPVSPTTRVSPYFILFAILYKVKIVKGGNIYKQVLLGKQQIHTIQFFTTSQGTNFKRPSWKSKNIIVRHNTIMVPYPCGYGRPQGPAARGLGAPQARAGAPQPPPLSLSPGHARTP